MATQMFKATPRKVREWVIDAITSGVVPMVKGPPGIGKSAIMQSIADEFRLKLVDHRLSTSAPEDLSGLPDFERGDVGQDTKATFRPFDIFPTRGTPIPDGKDGWLLFLDEANSGIQEVQAASYKLVLDRMTGQLHLHDNVAIALAGNRMEDKAIVNPLSTAMQSRLVHIQMVVSFKEWWEDVAMKQDYDFRIKGYLAWKGESSLMNFNPDHDDETFPCPRTWEFMNKLIYGKSFREITEPDPQKPGQDRIRHEMDGKIGLYAGTIGEMEAVSFVQYCKVTQDILTVTEILKDPMAAKLHDSAEMKWGQTTHLVDNTTDQNFAEIATYMNRYNLPFRVLYYRSVMAAHPNLRQHPGLVKAAIELAQWIYD
jgi:hypothetical protein